MSNWCDWIGLEEIKYIEEGGSLPLTTSLMSATWGRSKTRCLLAKRQVLNLEMKMETTRTEYQPNRNAETRYQIRANPIRNSEFSELLPSSEWMTQKR